MRHLAARFYVWLAMSLGARAREPRCRYPWLRPVIRYRFARHKSTLDRKFIIICYLVRWFLIDSWSMERTVRRKTPFEIDPEKVEMAREVLGTRTLTDTVDAALADLLFAADTLELHDPEVTSAAWH